MKYVFIHPFGFDFHFLANIAVQLLKTHCQMISNIVLLFLFFFFLFWRANRYQFYFLF